jgi:hypothetical protein
LNFFSFKPPTMRLWEKTKKQFSKLLSLREY